MFYYDLKEEAKRKTIGNVIARENELLSVARTLQRQFNNNLIIRGENGTGKSALLEGFIYRAASGKIPGFEDFNFIKLDNANLKSILSSNNPQALNQAVSGFRKIPKNTIVAIDDFQNIFGSTINIDPLAFFEPFIENSNLRLILAISEQGYQKLFQEQPGFLQYFEDISLKESDSKETVSILTALLPAFQRQYQIQTNSEILAKTVELSKKISSDKHLPLRAIHFFDECLAYAKISGKNILSMKEAQQVFADKTGIPSTALTKSNSDFLQGLELALNKNVIGQDRPIKIVADVIRRSRMGLRNPNKPYGSFLFLGPSGVGKTELCKILAKIVYGSERAFTRIDMSEFMEAHSVQRLIGAPPGYVGYENGGQLTNAIKEQPYSLILLDEIEKAHPKIFDIFLQVLEDGRLTDGQGQTVNFANSIVIATSNLGINEIVDSFTKGEDLGSAEFNEKIMLPILMRHFRTEFLNRFDGNLVFNPLSENDLYKIALLEIAKIEERVAEHGIKFNIEAGILNKKIKEFTNHKFGARPIKRFIEQTCENLVAMKLMHGAKLKEQV